MGKKQKYGFVTHPKEMEIIQEYIFRALHPEKYPEDKSYNPFGPPKRGFAMYSEEGKNCLNVFYDEDLGRYGALLCIKEKGQDFYALVPRSVYVRLHYTEFNNRDLNAEEIQSYKEDILELHVCGDRDEELREALRIAKADPLYKPKLKIGQSFDEAEAKKSIGRDGR